jgi:hypothetical protein
MKTDSFFTLEKINCISEYDKIKIRADIPSFCKAEKFYFKKTSDENNLLESNHTKDSIIFFKPLKLKLHTKYIMLSATLDEKICNHYFGANRIEFYDCMKVKYTGKLYQNTEHTMSRADIAKKPQIFDSICKLAKNKNRITFKKFSKKKDLYFGKTTGIDSLKGEDLYVIGTPHQPEFLYKLFAHTIGLIFDKNEGMNYRLVKDGGFAFNFMTYNESSPLRTIQFWMIRSELEQAIGRARLLHFDCMVNVFSNFPVQQAEQGFLKI